MAEVWRLLDHRCRGVGDPLAPGLVVAMLRLTVARYLGISTPS